MLSAQPSAKVRKKGSPCLVGSHAEERKNSGLDDDEEGGKTFELLLTRPWAENYGEPPAGTAHR